MTAPGGTTPWLGLAVLALPTMVIGLDLTVLHLATPSIVAALDPSPAAQLWIVDAYGFAVAGLLLTMGNVGDRIGRRRLLFLGAAGFALASVLASLADSPAWLIAARALMGIAGATLMPSTLSLIRDLFPDDRRRTVAISVWMGSLLLGGALGPVVGGLVLTRFWWGAPFLLAVPIMVLLLIVGPVVLPRGTRHADRRIDGVSVVLSLLAVLPVVYTVKHVAADSFDLLSAVLLLVGLLAGFLFVRRQRRQVVPLLDLTLFTDARFGTATAVHLTALLVQAGLQYLFALYLQLALGMSPLTAGLWTLPAAGLGLLGSVVAPFVARWLGAPTVIWGGLAVAGAGTLVMGTATLGTMGWTLAGFAILSFAAAAITSLTTDQIIAAVPPERAGMASGISETAAELGIALGVALLGSLATAVQVRLGPGALAENAARPVREAFTTGLQISAGVSGLALLLLAGLAARNLRTRSGRSESQVPV